MATSASLRMRKEKENKIRRALRQMLLALRVGILCSLEKTQTALVICYLPASPRYVSHVSLTKSRQVADSDCALLPQLID